MAKPKFELKFTDILFLILIIFICFLRLWKAIDWFSFNYDEEYQAFLAWSQVQNFHPIWIGVSASNFGFYLGPGFTYLNALLFAVSKGDLAILAIFSPLLGILTMISVYFVISKIFSKKAGQFSSIVYGLSPLLNFFDRRFWNPTPIPFLIVWLVYSLYQSKKDTRWFILTAAIMATSLHVHLSLVVLWPLVIYCVISNFKKIKIRTWIISILTYCVIVSPLMVFDVVHNFDDLLGPIRYVFSSERSNSVIGLTAISSHLVTFWHSIGRVIYLKQGTTIQDEMYVDTHVGATLPNPLVSAMSLIPILWVIFKIIKEKKYFLILASALSIALAFLVYPASGCEYFLLGFFTLHAIIIGLFLSEMPKPISFTLVGLMIIFSSLTIFTTNQTPYSFGARKELVRKVQNKINNSEIYISTQNFDHDRYRTRAGWCYLIRSLGTIPDSCPADESLGWIYSKEIRGNNPKYHVIISELSDYTRSSLTSQIVTSGIYTAEIIPFEKNNKK